MATGTIALVSPPGAAGHRGKNGCEKTELVAMGGDGATLAWLDGVPVTPNKG